MTPIQEAIKYWTKRREEAPTIQMEQAADLFLQYLNAALTTEQEFAKKCYELGVAVTHQADFWDSHIIRDQYKQQFLNQYYPKK